MKRLFGRERETESRPAEDLQLDAERGRAVVEESREILLVLDPDDRVVAASRRAREAFPEAVAGVPLQTLPLEAGGLTAVRVPVVVGEREETLLYLNEPGDLVAYEELRAGFTAAVSHELRTPLARLLAILETALLPEADVEALVEQARAEVEEVRELIDDVLFLSELETGREVVSLTATRALPVLDETVAALAERAERASVALHLAGDAAVALPLRPRMLRVVAENLTGNAIRYAGPGATCTLSVERVAGGTALAVRDDGVGVSESDLPRLFERFYRADQARASRGTGLGLAIVKHIVTAAGGEVTASGGRGRGLEIRCLFPNR